MPCEYCGEKFHQNRAWQRYCTSACRFAAWDEQHPRQRIAST